MKIKALVMDVDGTLTDGGIYTGETSEIMKKFYVRDGYAIKHLLPEYKIIPIIITGRMSEIVNVRCKELSIKHISQGSTNKLQNLKEILSEQNILLSETAYIGDDLNDLECMQAVALKGCPYDAVKSIREIADFVSPSCGGSGAVRDFIEWIIDNE